MEVPRQLSCCISCMGCRTAGSGVAYCISCGLSPVLPQPGTFGLGILLADSE